MRPIVLAVLIAIFATATFAADGKPVTYKSGDETVNAILYTPRAKAHFPHSSSSTDGGD